MAAKVSNLSDLLQRVACTCLTHPLARCHGHDSAAEDEETEEEGVEEAEVEEDEEEGASRGFRELEEGGGIGIGGDQLPGRGREAEALMEEVFQAVAAMKRAYVSLQEAHRPWDPDRMSSADAAVVAELRRLGRLRDRFRRGWTGEGDGRQWTLTTAPPLREAVAPYEAALEELKREVKVKEAEVESLKEKLRSFTKAPVARSDSGRKGRSHRAGNRLSRRSSSLEAAVASEGEKSCEEARGGCRSIDRSSGEEGEEEEEEEGEERRMSSRPSRSDAHLPPAEAARLTEETREYFDELAPKRHTKPQRSEYSDRYSDALPHSDGDGIPEHDRLRDLEADTEKLVCEGSEPREEFVETEYYKELGCVDKQHHTTGTGFIRVEKSNGSSSELTSECGTYDCHPSCRGNPATNEWIPSSEMDIPTSHKPNRSDV